MKPAIIGAATSRFGELYNISPRTLVSETVREALSDAGIASKNIHALYVGNKLSGILGHQENLGAFYAEELGLTCPSFKIEGACASGGMAVHNAYLAVSSGVYETVLVIGVEKMADHKPEDIVYTLTSAGSDEERISGITFPGLYALIARSYMEQYGITEKDLASVSVKNHYHGSLNPKAHFQKTISIEDVLKSPYVSDPLKLLDCSPISDGAAALIITSNKKLIARSKIPISIKASVAASDTLTLANRKNLTSLSASVSAGKNALEKAGVSQKDIDIAELHDCFSIAELIALEDLGFYKKGESANNIAKGELTLGKSKKLVVNTSGGLKACGHPVGATGVKQIVEIVDQLKDRAQKRQVKGARIGLTHNVGGSGAVAVVHILSRE